MYQSGQNLSSLSDFEPVRKTFRFEALAGLQDARKELPSKYFYDAIGSQLFEDICSLEEYYLTRIELGILRANVAEIASLLGPNCLLIEYGSGSSTKVRLLLDALVEPAGYVAIDIAKDQLVRSAASLSAGYPGLEVLPICADYTSDFAFPQLSKSISQRVAYFPGSTIGNFDREPARRFLQQMAKVCKGGGLLIGVDLKKDAQILHRAYNDAQGVTAHFNLHLLERINQELDGTFDLDRFSHYAFYHPGQSRIEMHLVSLSQQVVRIGEAEIAFKLGESIWTESSYKYTIAEFAHLAATAGWALERVWTDPQQLFSVQYLRAI
ncbi:MAG TPA: L-histidine N(alpha)-methyltransferase [Ktedonobacteraceae bacterium]